MAIFGKTMEMNPAFMTDQVKTIIIEYYSFGDCSWKGVAESVSLSNWDNQ